MKFSLGIEEEYQVIDPVTRELTSHEQKIVEVADKKLEDQVKAEMHQAVVEVGTKVCADIHEAEKSIRSRDTIAMVFLCECSNIKRSVSL